MAKPDTLTPLDCATLAAVPEPMACAQILGGEVGPLAAVAGLGYPDAARPVAYLCWVVWVRARRGMYASWTQYEARDSFAAKVRSAWSCTSTHGDFLARLCEAVRVPVNEVPSDIALWWRIVLGDNAEGGKPTRSAWRAVPQADVIQAVSFLIDTGVLWEVWRYAKAHPEIAAVPVSDFDPTLTE